MLPSFFSSLQDRTSCRQCCYPTQTSSQAPYPSPAWNPPAGSDLLDDSFPYDPAAPTLLTMLDMLPPAPPLTSAVREQRRCRGCGPGNPGPEPLTLDSYQAPGPGDGGTASLVGSNMFPNQYREAGWGWPPVPGPEAT